jgi:hypothetical protein
MIEYGAIAGQQRLERSMDSAVVDERNAATEPWWDDLDAAVLACLKANGAIGPLEVGRHLGLSESAATSLICLRALAGKVRICLAEPATLSAAEVHPV